MHSGLIELLCFTKMIFLNLLIWLNLKLPNLCLNLTKTICQIFLVITFAEPRQPSTFMVNPLSRKTIMLLYLPRCRTKSSNQFICQELKFTTNENNKAQIKLARRYESSCSACGHPLQDPSHLLIDCPAFEPLRRAIFGTTSIFDLWSRPWGVARMLGLRGVPPHPHPSEGVG